jgi:hypothetical protein
MGPWWLKLVGGAVVVIGLLGVGDRYGPNAWALAEREAEDKLRETRVENVNANEIAWGAREDASLRRAHDAFSTLQPRLGVCILTAMQADSLNLIREVR